MTEKIPPDNHVIRFVPNARVMRDESGEVLGIFPDAFKHRDEEEYLSVTWLEYFDSDYEKGFIASATAIRRQLEVKKKAVFAAALVENITNKCSDAGVKVRVLHEPEPENAGHAALRGLQKAEADLLAILAQEVFADIRSATSV